MIETIRLFKAVPVTIGHLSLRNADVFETYRKTMPKGFVLDPKIVASYTDIDTLIKTVDAECGLDPNRLNKAFHKSFDKVRSAPMEQLFIEQMAHYLTTYGAENFGIFNADRVYIPTESLDAPAIDIETFDFVVIRGLSYAEIKTELLALLATGAALSEQSVKDCLAVAALVNLTADEIEDVRNREVKIGLYELYGKVPTDPTEFLRYVVYKTTGSTLLIKSPSAIHAIKEGVGSQSLVRLFDLYASVVSLDRLGEIFLRYKPIFLALRADAALRPTINKIRRAAEHNHKPMPVNYLNNVTASIKNSKIDTWRLGEELSDPRVNIFRKIRLANALSLRADRSLDSIVYKVRNGKSYATEFTPLSHEAVIESARAYSEVIESIVGDLGFKFYGKKVYIPEGVAYGLPATEKQFIGNLPAGTSVHVQPGDALVAGIYWEDQGRKRVDLDLSVANLDGKIGWDGHYRNSGRTVLFSGDNTSAPNGASEVFWFDPSIAGSWSMNVNYFNFYDGHKAPFKIIVGTADASQINSNFVIDPNRLKASASLVLDVQQKNLGIIVADPTGGHRFFFSESAAGGGRSSKHTDSAEKARKFMMASLFNAPTLTEILERAGANFVSDPSMADEGFNLSPASLDKTTLLTLLSKA